MEVDVPTLEKIVSEMKADLRMHFAAKLIQRKWKRFILITKDKRNLGAKNAAASKL